VVCAVIAVTLSIAHYLIRHISAARRALSANHRCRTLPYISAMRSPAREDKKMGDKKGRGQKQTGQKGHSRFFAFGFRCAFLSFFLSFFGLSRIFNDLPKMQGAA
jgi:hypothetical protein